MGATSCAGGSKWWFWQKALLFAYIKKVSVKHSRTVPPSLKYSTVPTILTFSYYVCMTILNQYCSVIALRDGGTVPHPQVTQVHIGWDQINIVVFLNRRREMQETSPKVVTRVKWPVTRTALYSLWRHSWMRTLYPLQKNILKRRWLQKTASAAGLGIYGICRKKNVIILIKPTILLKYICKLIPNTYPHKHTYST